MADANTRFPYGYSGQTLTWAELERKKTVAGLHPEVRRRLRALMEAAADAGVPLGVGTGWRIQPTGKKGFAKPGNSNHEGFPADGQGVDALAIDTVPPAAWGWLGENCGQFGFRTFTKVNNEPWHIQPSEIPASRNRARVCPQLKTWDLPGVAAAVGAAVGAATPDVGGGGEDPANAVWGLKPLDQGKPELREGSEGPFVRYLQGVILHKAGGNISVDGGFGPQTGARVREVQSFFGATADGVVGPQTWTAIDALTNQ